MEQDAEAAGMASAGGLSGATRHPVVRGSYCRNCGAVIGERFCPVCGQLGADFQRPVWDLTASSLGDMFALDGRLWRSLPMLLLHPGRMTRDYIDGRRARFVPPFRLFLLTSVIFFLTAFTVLERQPWMKALRLSPGEAASSSFGVIGDTRFDIGTNNEADLAQLRQKLDAEGLTSDERAALETALETAELSVSLAAFINPDGSVDRERLRQSVREANPDLSEAELVSAQAGAERMANVYENQERFGERMKEWAPRFTLLFLPIFSLLLAISYAWHRRHYLYDHIITGLHFQTFLYVLSTLLILASMALPGLAPYSVPIGFLILGVYLWRMLRVTYDTGPVMALLRTGFLLSASTVVLTLLAAGLVVLSFFLT
jgi:hypothetical protein